MRENDVPYKIVLPSSAIVIAIQLQEGWESWPSYTEQSRVQLSHGLS